MAKRRRRNPEPSSWSEKPIPFEVALEVAAAAIGTARAAGGVAAVAGGLAIQLHGHSRNTKDVDIVSTVLPRLPNKVRNISFGGSIFMIEHHWGDVPLDVIVRDDGQQELYAEAAAHPDRIQGVPVINANYLAIIKFLAGRAKDELDFDFLVRRKLFSPTKVKRILTALFGKGAFIIIEDLEQAISLAEWRAKNERTK